MRIGFAKNDITPRVGVELCGFGPFRCRHSIGVRDRLWARAMALESEDGDRFVVITCDLVGVSLDITARTRRILEKEADLPGGHLMIACSHTHSGPTTGPYIGWGAPDEPYVETLPRRLAKAAVAALATIREASLSYAEVPCEGIGLNREYDEDAPPLDRVLAPGWRPEKPELTDTTCHVFRIDDREGKPMGFGSYFGCHPVVCCAANRFIHGDYPGVATNLIEREFGPDTVGLFFQGAQGDVNSCVVHKAEQESLLALDIIAGRYASAVRAGLEAARPVDDETICAVRQPVTFTRKPWDADKLRSMLSDVETRLDHPDVTDDAATENSNVRMDLVYAIALRRLLARAKQGESLQPETEVFGLRIGPLSFLGSPFETFQAIKNDVKADARSDIPLVTSFVNDSVGYATDKTCAARGGYAQDMVPLICGQLPFADAHTELVQALLGVDAALA